MKPGNQGKTMKFRLIAMTLLLASCSTHYMSKSELVNEFKAAQDSVVITKDNRTGLYKFKNSRGEFIVDRGQIDGRVSEIIDSSGRFVLYGFKSGQRINVTNKKGERVRIKVDHNSQIIINKDGKEKFQTYLVGTCLAKDLIYGYRSRILGTMRFVYLDDVKTVEVYSEFKSEEK